MAELDNGKHGSVPTPALRFVRRGTLRILQQWWAEGRTNLVDLQNGTADGEWRDVELDEDG